MDRIERAKNIIENVTGFSDTSTSVGEAWQIVLAALAERDKEIEKLELAMMHGRPDLAIGDLRQRAEQAETELTAATRIVESQEAQIMRLAQEREQAEADKYEAGETILKLQREVEILKDTYNKLFYDCKNEQERTADAKAEILTLRAISQEDDNILTEAREIIMLQRSAKEQAEARVKEDATTMRLYKETLERTESRLSTAREGLEGIILKTKGWRVSSYDEAGKFTGSVACDGCKISNDIAEQTLERMK